jgi:hypothetical protein
VSGPGKGPIDLFGLVSILSAGIRGGLAIIGFFGAVGADPLDFDLGTDDIAEAVHGIRDGQMVELGTLEIPNQTALHAAVVVVLCQVGIEADAFLARTEGCEKPKVHEQPKRAVHGVERNGRHCCLHRFVNRFCTGMILARSDGAEDYEALVRELDTRLRRNGLELLEPPLDFFVFY